MQGIGAMRWVMVIVVLAVLSLLRLPMLEPGVQAEENNQTIVKCEVEPFYKAVKLSWKVSSDVNSELAFEIHRSLSRVDGPFEIVATVEHEPGKRSYEYFDKLLTEKTNYFYKIVIPATGETFGPFKVRPLFNLPTPT